MMGCRSSGQSFDVLLVRTGKPVLDPWARFPFFIHLHGGLIEKDGQDLTIMVETEKSKIDR